VCERDSIRGYALKPCEPEIEARLGESRRDDEHRDVLIYTLHIRRCAHLQTKPDVLTYTLHLRTLHPNALVCPAPPPRSERGGRWRGSSR